MTRAVEGIDVAHREPRHALVALLHLVHGPIERGDRLLRLGDDGREEMRDAVVDGKLEHLGIDHQDAAVVRRMAAEQRQDHGVDADRLARSGRAGDEQVGHACEIGDDRLAADRLAERQRQDAVGGREGLGFEDVAQRHLLAARVGQLDTDRIAPRNDRDARASGAHRAGDIVGERDDARRFGSARGLELEQRHHGSRLDVADLTLDAEVGEHVFEQPRRPAQHRLRELGAGLGARGALQHAERGALVDRLGLLRRDCAEEVRPGLGLRSRHGSIRHARVRRREALRDGTARDVGVVVHGLGVEVVGFVGRLDRVLGSRRRAAIRVGVRMDGFCRQNPMRMALCHRVLEPRQLDVHRVTLACRRAAEE